jgi:pseudaminic acid synthase
MLIQDFKIGGRSTFIIAELSANHNQNYDLALKTIGAIKAAGADAVKLQTYTADTMTLNVRNEYFKPKVDGLWKGMTGYDLFTEAYTPWEWQPKLKEYAESIGLICFSSPFDNSSVDFLEKMSVPAYKIASFEITDIPLIRYVASKKKPIIISTGIALEEDIETAIHACLAEGNDQIAILKCTSAYPAPYDEINLKAIQVLRKKYNMVVGLSDHTLGLAVPIASVALGGKIIEKHFILSRSMGGPDSAFSMEPAEFKMMVEGIRNIEKALGKPTLELTQKALTSRNSRRSLFAVEQISRGEKLTEKNVRSIRPGNGLHPKYYFDILGSYANENIKKGTPLEWGLIENQRTV